MRRHGRQVQFDLLATVQHGQPVTGDDVLVRHCVEVEMKKRQP